MREILKALTHHARVGGDGALAWGQDSPHQQPSGMLPDDVAALTFDAFGPLFKAVKDQRKVDPDAVPVNGVRIA